MTELQIPDELDDVDRREFIKAGSTFLIAALWGVGIAPAQEKRMTDIKKPKTLPSVLTYDDVRAVSPALEHYTKGALLDGLWKRPERCDGSGSHSAHPDDRDAIQLFLSTRQRSETG